MNGTRKEWESLPFRKKSVKKNLQRDKKIKKNGEENLAEAREKLLSGDGDTIAVLANEGVSLMRIR
jgi:hypothetical protein